MAEQRASATGSAGGDSRLSQHGEDKELIKITIELGEGGAEHIIVAPG